MAQEGNNVNGVPQDQEGFRVRRMEEGPRRDLLHAWEEVVGPIHNFLGVLIDLPGNIARFSLKLLFKIILWSIIGFIGLVVGGTILTHILIIILAIFYWLYNRFGQITFLHSTWNYFFGGEFGQAFIDARESLYQIRAEIIASTKEALKEQPIPEVVIDPPVFIPIGDEMRIGPFMKMYFYIKEIFDVKLTMDGEIMEIAEWGLLGVVLIFILILVKRLLKKRIVKSIQRMRGVVYCGEAMREGSDFVKGENFPRSQIAVWKTGLLMDSFVGYAIRVKDDIIVMPYHVYSLAGAGISLTEPGDKPDKKFCISECQKYMSELVNDMVFVKVPTKILVSLNRTIAKLKSPTSRMAVSVTGREGTSEGVLGKHSTIGIVTFSGSTMPGYSGSSYHINEQIFGMHLAASGNVNIGVVSSAIASELERKFPRVRIEASATFSTPGSETDRMNDFIGEIEDPIGRKARGHDELWGASDFTSWGDYEVDYKEKIRWEADGIEFTNDLVKEMAESAQLNLQQIKVINMIMAKSAKGQATEEQLISLDVPLLYETVDKTKTLKEEIDILKNRVNVLESELSLSKSQSEQAYTEVRKLQMKKPLLKRNPKSFYTQYEPFTCPFEECSRIFVNPYTMREHYSKEHKGQAPFVPGLKRDSTTNYIKKNQKVLNQEGAAAFTNEEQDTSNPSGKTAFLGKNSQKKKSNNSFPNLNLKAKEKPSTSQTKNLRNMDDFQKEVLGFLEGLKAKLGGQNLDTEQK